MSGSLVAGSNGLSSTYSVFPPQQATVVEAPVSNFEPTVYNANDVEYQWDEAQAYSSDTGLFGGDGSFKSIGLALGGIVPVVIVIVVIAIIIAIIVELKRVNNGMMFTIGGRKADPQAPSWLDSIVSSFNDVESERLLNRMFPGGFHDIIDSIEGAYRRYRGLEGAADTKNN